MIARMEILVGFLSPIVQNRVQDTALKNALDIGALFSS